MGEWARGLSARTELGLVLGVAFGVLLISAVGHLLGALAGDPLPPPARHFTDDAFRGLLQYEAVVLLILGALLRARGWTTARLGLVLRASDVFWGWALVGAVLLVTGVLGELIPQPPFTRVPSEAPPSSFWILMVSLVNPVFEEVLLCGYLIGRLAPTRGVAFAANVSLAIRVACHLYQGASAVVAILPLGLLFTVWYVRTRRLWPLLTAHGVLDALALWEFAGT